MEEFDLTIQRRRNEEHKDELVIETPQGDAVIRASDTSGQDRLKLLIEAPKEVFVARAEEADKKRERKAKQAKRDSSAPQ